MGGFYYVLLLGSQHYCYPMIPLISWWLMKCYIRIPIFSCFFWGYVPIPSAMVVQPAAWMLSHRPETPQGNVMTFSCDGRWEMGDGYLFIYCVYIYIDSNQEIEP